MENKDRQVLTVCRQTDRYRQVQTDTDRQTVCGLTNMGRSWVSLMAAFIMATTCSWVITSWHRTQNNTLPALVHTDYTQGSVSVCVCVSLTCRMARTLLDVRLCCLDFLSRSMSSRPSSSSLDSLVSMATTSSPITPPPVETDTTGVTGEHPPPSAADLFTPVLPETGVLSSEELPVRGVDALRDVLSHLICPSVLRALTCSGQTSSPAERLLSVHWNTVRESMWTNYNTWLIFNHVTDRHSDSLNQFTCCRSSANLKLAAANVSCANRLRHWPGAVFVSVCAGLWREVRRINKGNLNHRTLGRSRETGRKFKTYRQTDVGSHHSLRHISSVSSVSSCSANNNNTSVPGPSE